MPEATADYTYDAFISYSHRDAEWVHGWLLPRLEAADLRICIDTRDFDVGVPSLVNMERAVDHSQRTLVVLSPHWVASEWTEFEALVTQATDPAGRRRRVLPLLLHPCEPPRRIVLFSYADFTKESAWDAQLERVVAAIRGELRLPDVGPPLLQLLEPETDAYPTAPQPVPGVVEIKGGTTYGPAVGVNTGTINYHLHQNLERVQEHRVPFMVDDLPPDFVARPNEYEAAIAHLLASRENRLVAMTAALQGAGGYGKTTLARAICHDPRIRNEYRDGILWVTLGNQPGDLTSRVIDLIETLTSERPGFANIDAATARWAEVLADRRIVLVIDDVWNSAHLRPFLQGGPNCTRLVTTRNSTALPLDAQHVMVDAMRQAEAIQLLTSGLSVTPRSDWVELAARLGEWPLLLTLVNGVLRDRVQRHHQTIGAALAYVNSALARKGLTVFDAKNTEARNQAVAKTLTISLALLEDGEQARYAELAIFPEDVDIPLSTLERLWSTTGGLDEFDTEDLCDRLSQLSLLLHVDLNARTIRLHDVVRAYLLQTHQLDLPDWHQHLLNGYHFSRWGDLPTDDDYIWDYLVYHLHGAGRADKILALVKDGYYLATKAFRRGTPGVEADLVIAERHAQGDDVLQHLRRSFVAAAHLLSKADSAHTTASTLLSRILHVPALSTIATTLETRLTRPYLVPTHPLPDLPSPSLARTFTGHTDIANACAVSANGQTVISASADRTLKVWDAATGTERHTLIGHTSNVNGCAISRDGLTIVSAASGWTLKVWDAATGTERHTLTGHKDKVLSCAISADGQTIISACDDGTLKVWDAVTGTERHTLRGHTAPVNGCAISANGRTLVSASLDGTLKVWDAATGAERQSFVGHNASANCCAISADGQTIVSASDDQTLKVWDATTGSERETLTGHTASVNGCAISADGQTVISASADGMVKAWRPKSGTEQHILTGHAKLVRDCAISADGQTIVSASDDQTLKVWDATTGTERQTLTGHRDIVMSCDISADGHTIVSASYIGGFKVWDATAGTERYTIQRDDQLSLYGCAISGDGHTIVLAGDWKLTVWDALTGSQRHTIRQVTGWRCGCAISADGHTIISACNDGTLKVWDAVTGTERHTLRGHTAPVNGCAISANGRTLVSASLDGTLKVWDVTSGAERRTLRGHTARVNGCAISANGQTIVSASDDQTLKVWDAVSGQVQCHISVDTPLAGCAYSEAAHHVIAVGANYVYMFCLRV